MDNSSMLELFRAEAETHIHTLTEGLLRLEENPACDDELELMMRAAHSIKGAARMVGVDCAVQVAHIMEDCFVAAQNGDLVFNTADIDILLRGVDALTQIAALGVDEHEDWPNSNRDIIDSLTDDIANILSADSKSENKEDPPAETQTEPPVPEQTQAADEPTSNIQTAFYPLFCNDTQLITDKINKELSRKKSGKTGYNLNVLRQYAKTLAGSAKMVGVEAVMKVAQLMLGILNTLEADTISSGRLDKLRTCIALINENIQLPADDQVMWLKLNQPRIDALSTVPDKSTDNEKREKRIHKKNTTVVQQTVQTPIKKPASVLKAVETSSKQSIQNNSDTRERVLRVSAERLNRLMGLAGESLVESRWIRGYADSLLTFKKRQADLMTSLDALQASLINVQDNEQISLLLSDAQRQANLCRSILGDRLTDLEEYDRRSTALADRLNREVIASRMRPFSDGTQGFKRMVRDVSHSLNKEVQLKVSGLNTQVDRDILEKIESPLNHIIRNSIDHGIESPDERESAGKPRKATIHLDAVHSMGMLSITIADDGRGVDTDKLRKTIVERKMVNKKMAASLSESELLDFLFLPGFSTREKVTEISGRGVGLDVVHSVIQEMRGQIRASSKPGKGMRIQLLLPLTLSVMRSLLVTISGQPYAFPLARIERILNVDKETLKIMDEQQYMTLDDKHIGLVEAADVLELNTSSHDKNEYSVIIVGDRTKEYGIVVEEFLGERDLAVHLLDERLGKIKDISAGALMEDGTPLLIVDVDDLIRSIDVLVSGERLKKLTDSKSSHVGQARKKILVVDDSITVREVERNLLESRGYDVDIAVDGMDGWNTIRNAEYDLVISDIDMPRMNGFEFVGLIKNDPNLKNIPVMIVSYKDREEDREQGLRVGADYYLTKGSFHDESLIDAVQDLIGGV